VTEFLSRLGAYGNCTVLIIAAIWQVKEISRVIKDHDPEKAGIDLTLLANKGTNENRVKLFGKT